MENKKNEIREAVNFLVKKLEDKNAGNVKETFHGLCFTIETYISRFKKGIVEITVGYWERNCTFTISVDCDSGILMYGEWKDYFRSDKDGDVMQLAERFLQECEILEKNEEIINGAEDEIEKNFRGVIEKLHFLPKDKIEGILEPMRIFSSLETLVSAKKYIESVEKVYDKYNYKKRELDSLEKKIERGE